MRLIKRALFIVPILLCISCTGFEMKKYDQVTVDQLQQTIAYEKDTMEKIINILKELQVSEDVIANFEVLRDSELARLNMWLEYEESKKLEE